MDPVTAIANAAEEGFRYLSKGLDVLFGNKQKKKLLEEQTKQIEELTEQERIRYDRLIAEGNDAAAFIILQQSTARRNSQQTASYLIIGGLMLSVILIIILKSRKK